MEIRTYRKIEPPLERFVRRDCHIVIPMKKRIFFLYGLYFAGIPACGGIDEIPAFAGMTRKRE